MELATCKVMLHMRLVCAGDVTKHTFVCAYFGTCAANSNAGEEAATRSPQTAYKIRVERLSDQSIGKGCASHAQQQVCHFTSISIC